MFPQRTVRSEVSVRGIGVHTGKPARLTIKPALSNYGITFTRTDLEGRPSIAAHYKNIVSTQLATTLGRGAMTVSTVEHVLAALQGLGVDNANIEVDGPEVPIMDGSSAAFCEAIESVGIEHQSQARAFLALRKKVEIKL
ncbi:MAG: UDP-3-O-acyl-N-acetylglucosamine deacetylase, partial [Bdellovibrionia bacterium]